MYEFRIVNWTQCFRFNSLVLTCCCLFLFFFLCFVMFYVHVQGVCCLLPLSHSRFPQRDSDFNAVAVAANDDAVCSWSDCCFFHLFRRSCCCFQLNYLVCQFYTIFLDFCLLTFSSVKFCFLIPSICMSFFSCFYTFAFKF